MSSQFMYQIDKLPNELLLKIFKHLNGKDLIACTLISEQWNYLISNDKYLWLSVYENEMNTGWLWLDKEIVNILNSFNVVNRRLVVAGSSENERMDEDEEQNKNYRKITELFLQMTNNPSCCMKNVYSYFMNMYKLEEKTLQTRIIPYLKSMDNEEIYFNCTILGPAVDTVHLSGGFMHTLLSWIDLAFTMNKQSIKFKQTHGTTSTTTTPWAGQGFLLRLPRRLSMNSGVNCKSLLFNTTILHSRKQMTRIRYCYGGSRLIGSCLVEAPTVTDQPIVSVNFTQGTISAISTTQIVFYVIDIRKKDSRLLHNQDNDNSVPLTNPYNSDSERWNEIRLELNALTNCMNSEQILVILGVGNQYNNMNIYNLIEIINNLGCGSTYSTVTDDGNSSDHHRDSVERIYNTLMDKPYLNWRLWFTSTNESSYTNLEEIFFWSAITYLNKSSILKSVSNESLTKRIKAIQNRLSNYYRVMFD